MVSPSVGVAGREAGIGVEEGVEMAPLDKDKVGTSTDVAPASTFATVRATAGPRAVRPTVKS
jgi:hypothetical protein